VEKGFQIEGDCTEDKIDDDRPSAAGTEGLFDKDETNLVREEVFLME
jgi:hypothetical protein